jgi:hypothetical protein
MLAIGRTEQRRRMTRRESAANGASIRRSPIGVVGIVDCESAWIDLPDASFDLERLPIPFPRFDEPE